MVTALFQKYFEREKFFMAKKEVKEWFLKGEKDLDEAKFLFENRRPLEDVAFFVHQSIEKYLKGFLISQGWGAGEDTRFG